MIISNLEKILRMKRLSVNKVSVDTGISRQTLTSLVNNESKGIQFSTLEILMEYLEVELSDLLINQISKVQLFVKLLSEDEIKNAELARRNKQVEDLYIIGFLINNDNNKRYIYFDTEISVNKEKKLITINTLPIIKEDQEDINIRNLKAFEKYFNKLSFRQFYEIGFRTLSNIIHKKFPLISNNFSYTVVLTWNLFDSKEIFSTIIEGSNNRLKFISSEFRTRENQNLEHEREEEIVTGGW
jgi:DNA-binding Xre family transcriptional regulator